MTEKNDFTWGKDKVLKNGNLGKIVAIPLEFETGDPENTQKSIDQDGIVDFEIDEFKEKMAEKLSKELHKKGK